MPEDGICLHFYFKKRWLYLGEPGGTLHSLPCAKFCSPALEEGKKSYDSIPQTVLIFVILISDMNLFCAF